MVLGELPFPPPLNLSQPQLGLAWDRTRSSAMRIRGLRHVGPLSIHWSMDELTWRVGGVGINRVEPKYSEKNLMTMACTDFVGFLSSFERLSGFRLEVERDAFSSTLRGSLSAFVV